MDTLDGLPAVAREAILARLDRRSPVLPAAHGILSRRRAVFVTLRIDGELRGCIGSLEAMHDDLVEETADRACAAAFEDPRFAPIHRDELEHCQIEVSVVGDLEPIDDPRKLDPARYGVVVADAPGRRGVLLPGIPGIETPSRQIAIAMRKAGIPSEAQVRLWRFEVSSHGPE